MNRLEAIKIGEEGEKEFRRWMNSHEIIFYPIDQRQGLLPKAHDGEKIKRPDYILWVKQAGFLVVDVKYYKFSFHETQKGFNIHSDEVESYLKFQDEFTSKIWFAVSNANTSKNFWYWISAKRVHELILNSNFHNKEFFVPLEKFKAVTFGQDLSQIIF